MMHVYRKQFILYKKPVVAAGIQSISCLKGLYLSYDTDLRVQTIVGQKTQCHYILIGYAIQSLPNNDDPEELLSQEKFPTLHEAIQTWSGRWVLITDNCVYTDVCGLLGLYYSNSETSGCVISSSIAWLKNECQFSIRADYQPPKYGVGIDFVVGPSTALVGVSKLMNTQYLEFVEGKFIAKSSRQLCRHCDDTSTMLKMLNESLICYFKNCQRLFSEIYLPLSAGYDSRTSGAALIASGVPFSAYTCIKKKMSNADRTMPARLCKTLGIQHQFIRPRTNRAQREARLAEFDAHTGGFCFDRDREYYGNNQYPSPKKKPAMLVGGGIWQIGNNTVTGKIKDTLDADCSVDRVFKNVQKDDPFILSLLNDYLKFARENPLLFDMAFSDRFYLEQRIGCWLSTIEQAIDLTDCIRLQPLNCAYMLSMYMSLPREYQQSCKAKIDLIGMNAPEWAKYPFNRRSYYEKFRSKVRRILR